MKPKIPHKNPYKGLFSYEEGDENVFYGRGRETQGLFQLVSFNFLTVVFGKAGIGKTSLLNAGVFPKLREEAFLPIRVRLNYSPDAPPLKEQIRRVIAAEIQKKGVRIRVRKPGKEGSEPAEPFAPDETLWEYFHRVIHWAPSAETTITPVLVLDQFEELFTLGKDHKDRDDLVDELYWLIENQFPTPHKERILKGRNGEKRFSFSTARPEVRVIISLREDYLAHLNGLKSRIASIDRNLFRVLYLNGQQAREVIGMPEGFRDQQVINDILRQFHPKGTPAGKTIPDEKLEIEPSLLSLLCHQLFEKQAVGTVTKADLDRVLEAFYDSVMKPFPVVVKRFIESKLLTEGGFRTPFYLEPGHRLRDAIDKLVDRRVLRRFHDGNKEYIEIIHDVLAPVINEKRNRRSKRTKNVIIAVLSLLLLVFACLTFYASYQKHRADEQYKTVNILRITAEAFLEIPRDNIRAIRIAEAAYRMGQPEPPARTFQALSAAGYSSFEQPFYSATFQHQGWVHSAVFSPDGTRILTASGDGTAKLWNLQGTLLADLNKHKSAVFSAVISPDGTRILTASFDGTAKLWDLQGTLLADLNKHKRSVYSAMFSPDGTRILTASEDGSTKLWDLQGNMLADLNKHNRGVNSAVFSPDGTRILTASKDGTAKVWLTPEAIYEWLQTAPIQQLSEEDKKELGIHTE